jgi:hypothetical protein
MRIFLIFLMKKDGTRSYVSREACTTMMLKCRGRHGGRREGGAGCTPTRAVVGFPEFFLLPGAHWLFSIFK